MALIFRLTKYNFLTNQLDIAGGDVYAELVISTPTNPLITTMAQISLASGGNYQRQILSAAADNRVYGTTGTGAYWTVSTNPFWESLVIGGPTDTRIKGIVVAKKAAGAAASANDQPMWFNDLNTDYLPNGANLTLVVPPTGLVEIT